MKVLSLKTALQATVPVALSPSKKRAKGISLKKMFIEQIRDGVSIEGKKVYKTVEARIHKGVFAKLKEGDFVDFFYMSKRSDNVICQISKKTLYPDFATMLKEEKVSQCLPALKADQLSEAICLYESIPGYKEKAKTFGVVAFQLRV